MWLRTPSGAVTSLSAVTACGVDVDGGVAEPRHRQPRMLVVAAVETDPEPARAAGQNAGERISRLSPDESAILWQLMKGRGVARIARDRGISSVAVRARLRAMLAKLEVGSPEAAVALAWRLGAATADS
jgi:DNA-binding NarL/FixJ family response regulator